MVRDTGILGILVDNTGCTKFGTNVAIPKNLLYQKRRGNASTAGLFEKKFGITDLGKRQKIHRQQNPAVNFLV